ncbi:MAG: CobW family GTP-binding protein [Nitrospirota bacterium]
MKVVQIAGYLGSGKTTLIIALSKQIARDGTRVAILVNDVGVVPVDGAVMQEYGLTVKDIGGGCICCQVAGSLMKTLDTLANDIRPDIVIIEPTGIAVPGAIRQTVLLSARKHPVENGHTVVLFDTSRASKLLTYDTLKRLVSLQIKDATIIGLSKSDLVVASEIEAASRAVREINPHAEIVRLSAVSGEGLSLIAGRIKSAAGAA